MKNIIITFGIIAACLGIIYCGTGIPNEQTASLQGEMELIVEPGENWFSRARIFLFFSRTGTPQLAAWIEDDNGNYISTITVTEKSANENWRFAPSEGRPEALPVWSHRQQATNELDAVSSATIEGTLEAIINRSLLREGNTYHVFLEVNHSFDYNDHWTRDNSGVNGQPSLVYHAEFVAGEEGNISLVPIGHGSVDGSDGTITRELSVFTSALNIVQNTYIVVK